MLAQLLNKLERKCRGRAIPHLMTWIVAGMALVFILDNLMILPLRHHMTADLCFDWAKICRGEIWRLVTFVFLPTNSSIIFVLLSMYLYWMIGTALENEWGTFKFNMYYLCGLVGTILSGMISGGTVTNYYLNLSLFLAFALLNPDFELMLFFILPVKMKWLAALDAVLLIVSCVQDVLGGSWVSILALAFAMLNVFLFFGGYLLDTVRDIKRRRDWRNKWR